jgi:hypothetical protein
MNALRTHSVPAHLRPSFFVALSDNDATKVRIAYTMPYEQTPPSKRSKCSYSQQKINDASTTANSKFATCVSISNEVKPRECIVMTKCSPYVEDRCVVCRALPVDNHR